MYDSAHINVNEFDLDPDGENIDKYPIPNEFLSEKMIYIHEYSIDELMMPKRNATVLPKDMLCMKDIGVIKYTIWAN